jgi:4,5-DOPA dioxygenase extradiol
MDRRSFLTQLSLGSIAMMTLSSFRNEMDALGTSDKMPVLFIGHGSPMNALEDNEFSRAWKSVARQLPVPKAILCVSAHWETKGTKVTAMQMPKTIHDFGGFPQELFDKQYPAPGSPEMAAETKSLIKKTNVELDLEWGLDHGTWSVLAPMFPDAKIPVYQISLDYTQGPQYHYELAKELAALRRKGVLIIGSGNIVHNLGMLQWSEKSYDWAIEFDAMAAKFIAEGNHKSLINYKDLGKSANLAIPSNEHYLPMLYTLALQEKNEHAAFFAAKTLMGSISMRSFKIG